MNTSPTAYAYDPSTGVGVDLAYALIVREPAAPASEHDFTNLDPEGYEQLDQAAQQEFGLQLIAALPTRVQLCDVDSEDQLTDDQLKDVFAGQMHKVALQINDHFADQRDEAIEEYIESALGRMGVGLEAQDLSCTHRDQAAEHLRAADTSDPYKQLLHQSRAMFLRYQLSPVPAPAVTGQDRRQLLESALGKVGLDLSEPTNAQAVTDLLENTDQHWHEMFTIDLIVHVKPEYLVPQQQIRAVQVPEPWIVVLDPVNGTGHSERFVGSARLILEDIEHAQDTGARFFPDDQGGLHYGQYGWDGIAGLSPTAHRFWPARAWVSPDPTSAAAYSALVHARKNWRLPLIVEKPMDKLNTLFSDQS